MKSADYERLFVPTYKRSGAPMVRGSGIFLYDTDGKEYLDFGSGLAVNALGHAHPLLLETLQNHAPLLMHASNLYYIQSQIEFSEALLKNTFPGKVFLCNSGTEANEAAIKFARKWAQNFSPDKYHILSFSHCFHGRTYGALSATAQERFHDGFGPLPPGFHYSPFNDTESARQILDSHKFAAILVEPLQGEGGINCADAGFLRFLREYSDTNSIALVFDEIQCGTGRTGTLWRYQHYDIIPDIMTLAKPIGGGLPLGALVCSDKIASAISPGDHGTTFGGNPLACALGCQILDAVSNPVFLERVRKNGAFLREKLEALAKKFREIESVRGDGLLLGVRFSNDPTPVLDKCRKKGLLLIKAEQNTIRFMPPLIVTEDQIEKGVAVFENALKGR